MAKTPENSTLAGIGAALLLGGGSVGGGIMDFQASKILKIELKAAASEKRAELDAHQRVLDMITEQYSINLKILADTCRY